MKTKKFKLTVVLIIIAILLVLSSVLISIIQKPSSSKVSSFESCKSAGGVILETFPEQCRYEERTFFAEENQPDKNNRDYVGLDEESALRKAVKTGKAARVVERDDEALPVTTDFSSGRLNLYVRDGKVYRVQVEGEI